MLKLDKSSPLDQPEFVSALRQLLQLSNHAIQIVVWSDEPHTDHVPEQKGEMMLYSSDFAPHQAQLTVRKMGRFMDQYKKKPLMKKTKTIDEYMRQPRPGSRAQLTADQLRQKKKKTTSECVQIDD